MKNRFSIWDAAWLILAALYFLVPLLGSIEFSLETGPGVHGFDQYVKVIQDPNFQQGFMLSLQLSVATVVLSIALMVPTVYWINLRLPRLRPVMDFIAVLPFVIPPITLGVAILQMTQNLATNVFTKWLFDGPQLLILPYIVLAIPFTYRSLDAGMRSINPRTLTEAAQSLGASNWTILLSVILPNLRYAILSAAFLTVTLVMGEYTVASVMSFNTFSVYMQQIGVEQANESAALAMLSLVLTWAAMFGILFLGRGRGRREVQVGGAR